MNQFKMDQFKDVREYPHYEEFLIDPRMSATWADEYAKTMSQALFTNGRHNTLTTFHAFTRAVPFGGSYLITGGQNIIFEWLQKFWRFDEIDQENMRNEVALNTETGKMERVYSDEFINFVANEPLRLTIDAMPEGELAFADEPIYRVHGPLWQCLMVEAAILNAIESQSMFATLASHIVELAEGAPVLEFSVRRQKSIGGLEPSRGNWLGGAPTAKGGGIIGTSNCLAQRAYGIPVSGTMAHAFVMTYENELQAFAEYAKAMPYSGIFLVDTYNTIEGIKKAIKTCKDLGINLKGVRLDSGDMKTLSRQARKLLDDAGFTNAKIVASDSLSYKEITRLKAEKAPIDIWAIGGYLGNSPDQPAMGPVYKLASVFKGGITQEEIDALRIQARNGTLPAANENYVRELMRNTVKLSETPAKTSFPGELEVVRYLKQVDGRVRFDGDTIIPLWNGATVANDVTTRDILSVDKTDDANVRNFRAGTPAYLPLRRAFNQGGLIIPLETVHVGRARAQERLAMLEDSHKGMPQNYPYGTGIEVGLRDLRLKMVTDIREKTRSNALVA